LKIAVVDEQNEKTIYLYDERDGWEYSAQVAIRRSALAKPDDFVEHATKELRHFLENALSALS
jgi:hypothetical protein